MSQIGKIIGGARIARHIVSLSDRISQSPTNHFTLNTRVGHKGEEISTILTGPDVMQLADVLDDWLVQQGLRKTVRGRALASARRPR